jgi:hypothetical protein
MALAILALLAAMWAGLVRLGWPWPPLRPTWPMAHGPLMIGGFLGTLISLERAVALSALRQAQAKPSQRSNLGLYWPYAAPLLAGLGALTLIVGVQGALGPLLITLGSLVLLAVFIVIIALSRPPWGTQPVLWPGTGGIFDRTQPALPTVTIGLGVLVWLVGNVLWLTGSLVYQIVLWWAGFLVLTIVGERLELSRLLRLSRNVQAAFLVAVGLFLAGLVVAIVNLDAGVRLAGLGMIALALWLLRYDMARRTVRQTGLAQFIAACLLSGYVWLGVSGVLALVFGGITAGPRYDAMLHTLFLGFVFAMIFGHAPIIFPAVLGVAVPFQPAFYAHLGLLHLSLILRVVSDLATWPTGRQWAGLFNVFVILLFLANTGRAIRRSAGQTAQ